MNLKQALPVALGLFLFIGCQKTKDEVNFKGTYKGKFIEGAANIAASTDLEMKFNGSNYVATNGTGKFKIEDSSKVKFSMANIASMDYVANKVLHGEYNYVIKGDSLILNKIFPPIDHPELTSMMSYRNQYRLKRIK